MNFRPILALPILALSTSLAPAGTLDVKTIPPDAKWILHLDADALAKTQTWKLLEPRLHQNPEFTKGVANLEKIFAAKFPNDLHNITLFGPDFDPKDAVVVIQANVDQERVKTLLSVNDTYTSQTISGYAIYGWIDKGKQLYGGFAENNRLIVAQVPERVAAAMDVLAGKVEALNSDELLGGAKNAGVIAYVSGSELAKLAQMKAAKNPIVGKLQSAWLTGGEDEKGVELAGHVVADNEAVAQNIAKTIEGFKAALSFAEQDDGDTALVAEALNGLTAKVTGKAVDLIWTVPVPLIGDALQRHGAATQP